MIETRGLWMAVLAGAGVLSAGCKASDDTGAVTSRSGGTTSEAPAADAVEERDMALVRVVNAVPGAEVTIWAGDSSAFQGVAFKKATEYQEIPDDRFNFSIRAAGPESEALAENRENLDDGGHYTIVALPAQDDPADRNLRVLNDDHKPVDPDKARVRFINGVPGDNDVDLFLRGREDAIFDGVNFATEAGWNEIEPGSGTLTVRPDGKNTALASLPNVSLEGGKSYTFVLAGKASNPELIRIVDDVAKDPTD
ncbi:MAG TPA: DUF4397 domain-containing protein [Gemmatimonadales bacterium]|nr:DUF4397 domain-containing protein [Gemmatimonadales bacterium]